MRPELSEIGVLYDHAVEHARQWKAQEEQAALSLAAQEEAAGAVPALATLCGNYVLEHACALPYAPSTYLPAFVLDNLYASIGVGRKVALSFITEIALQSAVPDGAAGADTEHEGRASLSTIHRSKGLEWLDIYSPWFNEGLMPTAFQEERDGNKAERHVRGCDAFRDGGKCNKDCKRFFAEGDAHSRGTPEQRHDDEERRLAHVAATRAKDRLTFVQVGAQYNAKKGCSEPLEPSTFEKKLALLPTDVLEVVVRE